LKSNLGPAVLNYPWASARRGDFMGLNNYGVEHRGLVLEKGIPSN